MVEALYGGVRVSLWKHLMASTAALGGERGPGKPLCRHLNII